MNTKILYVITKASWGGAQRYVYDLATAAKELKYEVAVAYGEAGELAERLKMANIDTFQIDGLGRDIRPWDDATAFFSLLRIIRSYAPNVVHLNSSKIGGLGTLAARLSGIRKIIFTAHGWAFNEARPQYQKAIIAFLAWLTILFSTRTILVSTAMKDRAINWPFTRRKMVIILNGTHSYPFLEKTKARRALVAMHPALSVSHLERDIWVGTVAELHPVKGLSYAIEAINNLRKKYPTIRYLIAGEGHVRGELETQIVKRELKNSVFLLGSVKEAPIYDKAYDIFLMPSLSEAIGIALLEAGMAGLPIIATRVGGMPEVITNNVTGLLIPPHDTEAIVSAIDSLLEDASLRQKFGTALQKCVETKFSIERVLRETFMLY